MEIKICFKCKEEKNINEFHKRKDTKDGLNSNCKECTSLYYQNNHINIKEKSKKYYDSNKEKIIKYKKIYYKNNKQKLFDYQREYDNIEDNKLRKQKYFIDNKEKIIKYLNQYNIKRRNSDPLYKFSSLIRNRISKFIKFYNKGKYIKSKRTEEILGCSFKEFLIYLESKFEPWMSWDNHGLYNGEPNFGWDIDHIIPLSSSKTKEETIKLNHYTNLQPLCSKTNRYIKKDKWNQN